MHPRYLDAAGLTAAWREGLLAQAVLAGRTRGYRHHPQLLRFFGHEDPLGAIGVYLSGLADEADRRGYHFNRGKILAVAADVFLEETQGQLAAEWALLGAKLRGRSPAVFSAWTQTARPRPHPLFRLIEGPMRDWEKGIPRRP